MRNFKEHVFYRTRPGDCSYMTLVSTNSDLNDLIHDISSSFEEIQKCFDVLVTATNYLIRKMVLKYPVHLDLNFMLNLGMRQ